MCNVGHQPPLENFLRKTIFIILLEKLLRTVALFFLLPKSSLFTVFLEAFEKSTDGVGEGLLLRNRIHFYLPFILRHSGYKNAISRFYNLSKFLVQQE